MASCTAAWNNDPGVAAAAPFFVLREGKDRFKIVSVNELLYSWKAGKTLETVEFRRKENHSADIDKRTLCDESHAGSG